MSERVSDEALLRRALAVRAGEAQLEAALAQPGTEAVIAKSVDPGPFLRALASATSPPAIALLSEAAVLAGTGRSRHAHLKWLHTATLPPASVAPVALSPSVRIERDEHRRAALTAGVEKAERDARDEAIAVVRSLRSAASALDEAVGTPAPLVQRLGWLPSQRRAVERAPVDVAKAHGPPTDGAPTDDPTMDARALAGAVLAATKDAHHELWRARARAVAGRGVSQLSRADHPALARCERADALIPLPDRVGIASRWCERIGVMPEEPAGGLPSAALGAPLTVRWTDAEARPRVLGAPAPDVHGVRSLLAVVGELMAQRRAVADQSVTARMGIASARGITTATLARELLLTGPFLMREAGIDRSHVQPVLRELLYAELSELRLRAAETLALTDALEGTAGLGEVIAETYASALGTTVAPDLAPFRVCEAWLAEAPRWLVGARLAPGIHAALVAGNDEDWFRNPRAGAALLGALETIDAEKVDADALEGAVRRWFDASGA